MISTYTIVLNQGLLFVGRDKTFDFISVTPPYMEVNYETLMDQISKSALIGEDTFIVSGNHFSFCLLI